MFDWWVWLMIWAGLVLCGLALCGWLGWGVWLRLRRLSAEVSRTSAMVGALEAETRLPNLPSLREPEPLAIFEQPADMARRRAAIRAESRAAREERRVANRPGWAHSVD